VGMLKCRRARVSCPQHRAQGISLPSRVRIRPGNLLLAEGDGFWVRDNN
jgi:hypothetical protein